MKWLHQIDIHIDGQPVHKLSKLVLFCQRSTNTAPRGGPEAIGHKSEINQSQLQTFILVYCLSAPLGVFLAKIHMYK